MNAIYCPNCHNTKKFTVSAKEYHTWIIDGNGNWIENVSGYGGGDRGDDFYCASCNGAGLCHFENLCDECMRPILKCICEKEPKQEPIVKQYLIETTVKLLVSVDTTKTSISKVIPELACDFNFKEVYGEMLDAEIVKETLDTWKIVDNRDDTILL